MPHRAQLSPIRDADSGASTSTATTPMHESHKVRNSKISSAERKKKANKKRASGDGSNILVESSPLDSINKCKKKKEEKKLKPEAPPSRILGRARKAVNYCEDDEDLQPTLVKDLINTKSIRQSAELVNVPSALPPPPPSSSSSPNTNSLLCAVPTPVITMTTAPMGTAATINTAPSRTPEHPPIVLRISKGTSRLVSTDSEEPPNCSPAQQNIDEVPPRIIIKPPKAGHVDTAAGEPSTTAHRNYSENSTSKTLGGNDGTEDDDAEEEGEGEGEDDDEEESDEPPEINYCTVKISPDKPPKERLKLIIKTDVIRNAIAKAAAAAAAKEARGTSKETIGADGKKSKSKKHKRLKHVVAPTVAHLAPESVNEFKTPSPHLALSLEQQCQYQQQQQQHQQQHQHQNQLQSNLRPTLISPAERSEHDFDSQSSVLGSISSKGNSTPQLLAQTVQEESCVIRSRGSSVITSDLETSQHSSLVAPPSDIESRLESMMMSTDGSGSGANTKSITQREQPLEEDILDVLRGNSDAEATNETQVNGESDTPESKNIKRVPRVGRGKRDQKVPENSATLSEEPASATRTRRCKVAFAVDSQSPSPTKRPIRRAAKKVESLAEKDLELATATTSTTVSTRRARGTRSNISVDDSTALATAQTTSTRGATRKRKNPDNTETDHKANDFKASKQLHTTESWNDERTSMQFDAYENSNNSNHSVNAYSGEGGSASPPQQQLDYKFKDKFKRTITIDDNQSQGQDQGQGQGQDNVGNQNSIQNQSNMNVDAENFEVIAAGGGAAAAATTTTNAIVANAGAGVGAGIGVGVDGADQERTAVKLVISKRKGSIFKSRALVPSEKGDQIVTNKRHLYKHSWDANNEPNDSVLCKDSVDDLPLNKLSDKYAASVNSNDKDVYSDFGEICSSNGEPTNAQGKLARFGKQNTQQVNNTYEMSDSLEGSSDANCKNFYTVVRNVKTAHQIQEIGEYQEMDDDVEYILDALQPHNPPSTRSLSALQLATKCMTPAFRMHVRAHGVVTKFFKALSDANTDLSLGLCTSAIMFILSQEGLNMDLDCDSLELMINLLEAEGIAAPSDRANYERNRQKVRELCEEIKAQGKAMHLNVESITVGTLAMETLLSLTSKRAGEWFKEELRKLGGLEHIIKTISEFCRPIIEQSSADISWTQALLENMQTVARCLRVLENVTHYNETNQNYVLTYDNGSAINTLCTIYRLCDLQMEMHPTNGFNNKDHPGNVMREVLIPIIKVLNNLTHSFSGSKSSCLGAELLGQRSDILETSFRLLLLATNYIPDNCVFEISILVMSLLINLTIHTTSNRAAIMRARAPSEYVAENADSSCSINIVQAMIEYFYKCEELARLVEKNTDAFLESNEKTKKKQEEVDETVNNLMQRAGHHMEHTLKGSYVGILIGHLITDNEEHEKIVRSYMRRNSFKELIAVLEKYHTFMNLTASSEASIVAHIKSTKKLLDYYVKRQYLHEHEEESPFPQLCDVNKHAAAHVSHVPISSSSSCSSSSNKNNNNTHTDPTPMTSSPSSSSSSTMPRVLKTYSHR